MVLICKADKNCKHLRSDGSCCFKKIKIINGKCVKYEAINENGVHSDSNNIGADNTSKKNIERKRFEEANE